jgi:hypothetical protein
MTWYVVVLVVVGVGGGVLAGCTRSKGNGTGTPGGDVPPPTDTCTPTPPPPIGATPPYRQNTPEPPTPTPTPPEPTPEPTPEIEWFEEDWLITHYIYALEDDPEFTKRNDDKVFVPGLDPNKTYLRDFIYGMPDENGIGPRGVAFQGTGKSAAGEYITIDHLKTNVKTDPVSTFHFIYGEGGTYAKSVPWETVGTADPRLTDKDKVVIEIYPGKVFTVTDTGTALAYTNHLDVFVGEMTLAEADALGWKHSRVGKVVEP